MAHNGKAKLFIYANGKSYETVLTEDTVAITMGAVLKQYRETIKNKIITQVTPVEWCYRLHGEENKWPIAKDAADIAPTTTHIAETVILNWVNQSAWLQVEDISAENAAQPYTAGTITAWIAPKEKGLSKSNCV